MKVCKVKDWGHSVGVIIRNLFYNFRPKALVSSYLCSLQSVLVTIPFSHSCRCTAIRAITEFPESSIQKWRSVWRRTMQPCFCTLWQFLLGDYLVVFAEGYFHFQCCDATCCNGTFSGAIYWYLILLKTLAEGMIFNVLVFFFLLSIPLICKCFTQMV